MQMAELGTELVGIP